MAGKKRSDAGNEIVKSETATSQGNSADRTKKIMNAIVNTSIILMSTLMGAFTEIMVNATGAAASGLAETMGGKDAGEQVQRDFTQKLPEVNEKMKKLISDVRKDVHAQLGEKAKDIAALISDSKFDVGPRIIEKYDFKLPKLTEELDDTALAQYAQLLTSEDVNFAEMFKELTDWINSLPKFPDKTRQQ